MQEEFAVEEVLKGYALVLGKCEGEVLATLQPIAFAGGVDPSTGRINDPKHDLFRQSVSNKVLAFPHGKGSSATSLFIAELVRINKAPLAIINIHTEPILAAGALISKHFYNKVIPILVLEKESFHRLKTGQRVLVDATCGSVTILGHASV